MKRSWRLVRLAGVDIHVHWTFSIFPLWLLWQSVRGDLAMDTLLFITAALLLLFTCIALHELGHALAALRFKVVVKNVMLLPIGGIAQIQTLPRSPWHDLFITVAGPVVNLVIIVGLALVLVIVDLPLLVGLINSPLAITELIMLQFPFSQAPVLGLIIFLLFANVVLLAFNLIPVFPMDGGRVLRAVLAMFMTHKRATQVALGVGQLIGLLLILESFRSRSLGLLLIAAFVLMTGLPFRIARPIPGSLSIRSDD